MAVPASRLRSCFCFRIDDFDAALRDCTRARRLSRKSRNTGAGEFALRDPGGCHVKISALAAAWHGGLVRMAAIRRSVCRVARALSKKGVSHGK